MELARVHSKEKSRTVSGNLSLTHFAGSSCRMFRIDFHRKFANRGTGFFADDRSSICKQIQSNKKWEKAVSLGRPHYRSMVHYYSIRPEAPFVKTQVVPAELKSFRIPFLAPVCLENATCDILKQCWHGSSYGMRVQFTQFDAKIPDTVILMGIPYSFYCLVYVQEGDFLVGEKNGTLHVRREGTFFLRQLSGNREHLTYQLKAPGIYKVVYVSISKRRFGQMQADYPFLKDAALLSGKGVLAAGSKVKSIVGDMQAARFGAPSRQDLYYVRCVTLLYDAFLDLAGSYNTNWLSLPAAQRMDHLKDYIDNNLAADLSLKGLAGMLHMSESGLKKAFQKIAGMSLSLYVQKKRIAAFCLLLDEGKNTGRERPWNQIGYQSRQGFVKAFKKEMGCNPYQYRRRKLP